MHDQQGPRPKSPLIPSEGVLNTDMSEHHDSGVTTQASEMVELEKRLESMKLSESQLRQQYTELANDLQHTKKKAEHEVKEARNGLGELSKTRHDTQKLQEELKALKESEKQAVQDVKMRLDRERKKWLKLEKGHKTEIESLKKLVEEKNAETDKLKKKTMDMSRGLSAARAQAKATIDAVCPLPTQRKQSNGGRPNRFSVPGISNPLDRIKELESENARLEGLHKPHGCEDFSEIALQEVANAEALQEAAEAEIEGYRHFEHANKILMEKHAADTQQIVDLIQEMERYKVRAKQLEASVVTASDDAKTLVVPTLELSTIVPCASVLPVTPQGDDAEFFYLEQRFHTAELEIETLLTENAEYARSHEDMTAELNANFYEIQELETKNAKLLTENEQLASQLEINIKTLNAKDQNTEQQIAQAKEEVTTTFQEKLEFLEKQQKRQLDALSADRDLRPHLEDLGTSILSLSTPPAPKLSSDNSSISPSIATTTFDNPIATSDPLPNIALTINIKPSEKRNWALLRHVQSAISTSSSLEVRGPRDLVRDFVAGMQDAERMFKEKTELAEKLEMAIVEAQGEIEMLRRRVREEKICMNPRHRALEEELEAKEMQFQMQSQLLAEWGKREG